MVMSSSPNPYSDSKGVFTKLTLTRNEQNVNEQKHLRHLLPNPYSGTKGVFNRQSHCVLEARRMFSLKLHHQAI